MIKAIVEIINQVVKSKVLVSCRVRAFDEDNRCRPPNKK